MITNESNRMHFSEIVDKIKRDIKAYFVIKTMVSLTTATLSYFVMVAFKLDFVVFWAFLIFILNFIPSVGSVIAVMFPILLSVIQFDTYYPFVFISMGLIGTQVLM